MATYRKRIPYGMMNFIAVRRDDCYYVDKTRFIPVIEQANRFFFYIRPRRFGKSLTVSMLKHYYDVLQKDKFEELYGNLYIGKHPTSDRNSYLIIYLNFSVVDAGLKDYRRALDAHCNTASTTTIPTKCFPSRVAWTNIVQRLMAPDIFEPFSIR